MDKVHLGAWEQGGVEPQGGGGVGGQGGRGELGRGGGGQLGAVLVQQLLDGGGVVPVVVGQHLRQDHLGRGQLSAGRVFSFVII